MPLLIIANSPSEKVAQEGFQQWKDRHPDVAELLAVVERRTGAAVVGVAGERSQLTGWRFDRELAPALPLAA